MPDAFGEFGVFMDSLIHHWVGWVTSSALVAILATLNSVYGWKVPKWAFVIFLAAGFFISCFRAWQDQYRENEANRLAGSLVFKELESFWLDQGNGTATLQAGLVLTNIRDRLIEFHVEKFEAQFEGTIPQDIPPANLGGYAYPAQPTTFRVGGITIPITDKRPLNGELAYMIRYNIVASDTVHHSGKKIRFDYYPPNDKYPSPSIRWQYLGEHED
jgi:hypothetical protein